MSVISMAERTSLSGRRLLTYEERLALRQERSRCIKALLPHEGQIFRPRRMPVEILELAYDRYLRGSTVTAIAIMLYADTGYSSPKSCAAAISSYIRERQQQGQEQMVA